MTLNEIAKALKMNRASLTKYFSKAAEQNSLISANIKLKLASSRKNAMSDYSLDETLFALSFMPTFTKSLKLYLKEHFILRASNTVYMKQKPLLCKDAEKLLENTKIPCCSNCIYISPRQINSPASRYSPFCTFFSAFLNKALPKRNIYKDYCPAFSMASKPTIFTTSGFTLKTRNTTLGIPNSAFSSGLTPPDSPIQLLIPQPNQP